MITTEDGWEVSRIKYDTLDPITVFVAHFGTAGGRIVIVCFGEAWSATWAAMGTSSLREFFVSADTDYLVGKLIARVPCSADKQRYLARIVDAVKEAFRKEAAERKLAADIMEARKILDAPPSKSTRRIPPITDEVNDDPND